MSGYLWYVQILDPPETTFFYTFNSFKENINFYCTFTMPAFSDETK